MPEGPEVEVVRRGLLNYLGRKITGVTVSEYRKYAPQSALFHNLVGTHLGSVERRGKMLLFTFEGESALYYAVNHLGMTGNWKTTFPIPESLPRHFKFLLRFGDSGLMFTDPRTFGRFDIYQSMDEIQEIPYLQNLGPDILAEPFDTDEFVSRVRGDGKRPRRKEIARLLLEPDVVAGCGNIYKCEALFRANIDPFRSVISMSDDELTLLGRCLSEVAHEALSKGGSTLQDFKDVTGYSGMMQNTFAVYGREGEECVRCDTLIVRRRQGGRSTFYCPSCQK